MARRDDQNEPMNRPATEDTSRWSRMRRLVGEDGPNARSRLLSRVFIALIGIELLVGTALAQGTPFCETSMGNFLGAAASATIIIGLSLVVMGVFAGGGVRSIAFNQTMVDRGNRMSIGAIIGAVLIGMGIVLIVWIFSYSSVDLSTVGPCVPIIGG